MLPSGNIFEAQIWYLLIIGEIFMVVRQLQIKVNVGVNYARAMEENGVGNPIQGRGARLGR
jgi:hypothetical protein